MEATVYDRLLRSWSCSSHCRVLEECGVRRVRRCGMLVIVEAIVGVCWSRLLLATVGVWCRGHELAAEVLGLEPCVHLKCAARV